MLVVGPMGARPWLTVDELVEDLEALGIDVVVNGRPEVVLPMPPAWRRGVLNVAADWIRWRGRAERSLRRAGIKRILVWDPVLALLCRMARPRGVEIIWAAPAAGPRVRDRAASATARRMVDRVALAPPVLPRSGALLLDEWVVFGTSAPVADTALATLGERANSSHAAALVFDARDHETISAGDLARLVEAASPRAVWWCGDDEWVQRLGGVPRLAIDPAPSFEPDHRHLRVLGAEGVVMRVVGSGLTDVTAHELRDVLDDERQWAESVFRGTPR